MAKRLRFPLCLLIFACCAIVARGADTVAVLAQPGLQPFGGDTGFSPGVLIRDLKKHGIDAEALNAEELADPKRFNTASHTVLVMTYRNSFPLNAFENIRAFRRGGGSLVMNGTPFCHPCEPPNPPKGQLIASRLRYEWRDLGHQSKYMAHDEFGVGVGGFGSKGAAGSVLTIAADNPLGLKSTLVLGAPQSMQSFDGSSLDAADEIVPLVTRSSDNEAVAVLIRHRCDQFNGARDVWLGRASGTPSALGVFAARQMFVRGVAWCLLERGAIESNTFESIGEAMDTEKAPEPLPSGLTPIGPERSWGGLSDPEGTYFPKSPPPARRLLIVDMGPLTDDERLALISLQGLTARRQPRLWLIHAEKDRRVLEWHRELGHIDDYEFVKDWRGLFEKFRSEFKGAIVPDEGLYGGSLLACNVAGCRDLIVASAQLARELRLPIKVDLRERFDTFAKGLQWTWETYRNRLNPHLSMVCAPERVARGALSYDIEFRSFIFWISGREDGDLPGADRLAEVRVVADVLSQCPPNGAVRGFPSARKGVGIGEIEGVRLFSNYAKGLVPTTLTGNMCAMSGVRIDRLKAPTPAPAPAFERDKVYIALTMSDGDNLNTWAGYFPDYFEHPAHGEFPIAWGMGPSILDLMPAVAQWRYQHAKPTDEFIVDVSGIAYVNAESYASTYLDRERVRDGFVKWTDRYMKRLGMSSIRVSGGPGSRDNMTPLLEAYARSLPSARSFLPDYGRKVAKYEDAVYRLNGGRPVFRAITLARRTDLIDEVRRQVGDTRPAFVNAFVHNWSLRMDGLLEQVRSADDDMVFVTPSQLADLYDQADR